MGLGSLTISMWLAEYKNYFLAAAFLFLGFSHWRNWKSQGDGGRWNRWILHGTTVLTVGLILYSLVSQHSWP